MAIPSTPLRFAFFSLMTHFAIVLWHAGVALVVAYESSTPTPLALFVTSSETKVWPFFHLAKSQGCSRDTNVFFEPGILDDGGSFSSSSIVVTSNKAERSQWKLSEDIVLSLHQRRDPDSHTSSSYEPRQLWALGSCLFNLPFLLGRPRKKTCLLKRGHFLAIPRRQFKHRVSIKLAAANRSFWQIIMMIAPILLTQHFRRRLLLLAYFFLLLLQIEMIRIFYYISEVWKKVKLFECCCCLLL